MKAVDCVIDLKQLEWVKIPDGMELRICTIPAGATIHSAGVEADNKFHIRYSVAGPSTCSLEVG